jgi:hypothetical protein
MRVHVYVCVSSARGIVRARDARGDRWVRSMVGIVIRIESFALEERAAGDGEFGGRGDAATDDVCVIFEYR